MSLQEYFKGKQGVGVLSTADSEGKVDAAVYATPHVIDDTHLALIMGDRLSHANLRQNPHAVYLFKEDGPAWEGKRLYLKMERETGDLPVIQETCKLAWPGPYCSEKYLQGSFLVTFAVEKVLPLVVFDKK